MKRLNNLYYSKRIKELLAELQTAGTTLVVAPMGYGKTLAVQYFLQEQERCGKKVLRQSIYGAGAEAFWQGVCHSWQGTELGAALLQQSLPADANARTLVLELFRQLLPQEPVYWFIDDLHLLESSEAIDFLFALSKAGFADLHLLLVSRGQILTAAVCWSWDVRSFALISMTWRCSVTSWRNIAADAACSLQRSSWMLCMRPARAGFPLPILIF